MPNVVYKKRKAILIWGKILHILAFFVLDRNCSLLY